MIGEKRNQAGKGMNRVRPFIKDDVEQVGDLHHKVFGNDDGSPARPPTPALRQRYAEYFERVFFSNPWLDDGFPSYVHEESTGRISGFIGVLPRRMLFKGESISVAISSQFIVDPDSRITGAGIRLMKTFLTGPQELSFTDEANNTSRKLWEGLGGTTALLYSIHWTKQLRPGTSLVRRITGSGAVSAVAGPVGGLVDSVLARKMPHRFSMRSPDVVLEEMDRQTLLECIIEFSGSRALWPHYDDHSLGWVLRLLENRQDQARLRMMVVRDNRDETMGWFVYHLRPDDRSYVIQLMARNKEIETVLDCLFYDAWRHGSLDVTGRLDPQFMQAYREKFCQFECGAPWLLIASPNREVIETFQKGDAMLSSLEGELGIRFS